LIRRLLNCRFGDPAIVPAPPDILAAARHWLSLRDEANDLGAANFELATLWLAAIEGFLPDAPAMERTYEEHCRDYHAACRLEVRARRKLEAVIRRGELYRVDGLVVGLGAAPHDDRVFIHPSR
jgi:hypothetical protein